MQAIYDRLPVWGQNLCCSLYGGRLKRRRYDSRYEEIRSQVYAADRWSRDQLKAFQLERLKSILEYATVHVPYYRDLFQSLRLTAYDIHRLEDIQAIPLLQKETVRRCLPQFVSEQVESTNAQVVSTSGTTGTGLRFPVGLDAECWQWAVVWRGRWRFGLDSSCWYGHFFGRSIVPLRQERPPFWRVNRPGRQVFFSAYHMQESNLPAYVQELNRRRLTWIQGYPSILTVLARYIVSSGDRLHYTPTYVGTSSETLFSHQKDLIQQAFGTACHQKYGQTETTASISECPKGRLHVDEDLGYVEFLPNSDGTYKLVATGLHNFAFPLIRYDTGDIVTLPSGECSCPCGLPGRVVVSVDGRIEDYIFTPDGRKIGRMGHAFKGVTSVKEAQLVQTRIDKIVVRVVAGQGFGQADERRIRAVLRRQIGPGIELEFRRVPSIERTENGKLRFVVSELDAARSLRTGHLAEAHV